MQVVCKGMSFLAEGAQRDSYKALYANPEVMQGICEKIIVPNMMFHPADEELFEGDEEEFIKRDIEVCDKRA